MSVGPNYFPVLSSGWDGIAEFLGEIFGSARGKIWTTAFESFATGENWNGSAFLPGWETRFPTMDADMFFAIGLMGEGETRRSNTGVVSQPLLIVDDVGTKVSRADWDALFAVGCPLPTARIETSPGNETWIWALDGDASDPVRWQDLALIRAWLIERKLTDEVMDPARYVRLPGGWNSKPKYRGADGLGAPPRVSFVDWRPPSVFGRVSVDELGAAIVGGGLAGWRTSPVPVRSAGARATLTAGQLAAGGGGALARTADLNKPDALLRLALEIGLSPRQVRGGVVEADCPNMGSHTTRADTGFAFLGDGLMQCNHASCQGHNTVSFREMMLDRLAGVLGSERAAGEWWALEQVRDAGGLDDGGEAATVAAAMASARAERVQREEAAAAAGLDGLLDRFVWVTETACFYDLAERRLVGFEHFDTHPAVRAVFEVGLSGLKRGRSVVLNDPRFRSVDGMVRATGDASPLVDVPGPTGAIRSMVNLWQPSVWHGRARKRLPVEWLELVRHVIPDDEYRGWFIQWLAWGFQRPGERRMTIPVIVGGQGIGKDAMLIPVRTLMGNVNMATVSMNQIGANFNEWMLKDLVVLPELKLSADGRMYNQIKDWTSNAEDWVSINEKFQTPYVTRVNFSLISFTNHLDAIKGLEPDDRRWGAYISPAAAEAPDFYARIIGGMTTPDALAGLLDYLLTVDLAGFTPFTRAPGQAEAKREMQAENLRGGAQWAFQALDVGGRFEGRTMLTIAELQDAALADPNNRVRSNSDTFQVQDGLKAAGWERFGQIRFGQNRNTVWLSPECRESLALIYGSVRDVPPKHVTRAHKAEVAGQAAKSQILPF